MNKVVKLGIGGDNENLVLIEFEDGTTLLVGQTPVLDKGYHVMETPNPIHHEHEQVWERR